MIPAGFRIGRSFTGPGGLPGLRLSERFIARISRGRTVREFVLGVLKVRDCFCALAAPQRNGQFA